MPRPYFQDEAVVIYHADCRDILPLLEPGSIDLVLTDPPYGAVTHEGARSVSSTRTLVDFPAITSEWLSGLLASMSPVCRAWFVATMEWRHIADIERQPPTGWRFVRFGIWVKPNGAPQSLATGPQLAGRELPSCTEKEEE